MNNPLNKIIFLVFLILIPNQSFCSPAAKITAKILTETGQPIQGAKVTLSFSHAKIGDGGGITNTGIRGISDGNGLFSGEAKTLPYTGVVVDKEGYYRSIQKYEFKSRSGIIFKKWEPWNPTIEVILKKKRNPVPMYDSWRETYKIPVLDKPIGFDLEKNDWVSPYGIGIISDFIFTFHVVDRAYRDYECSFTLTFSNEKDGIQEYYDNQNQSLYKWPFEAPLDGYKPVLTKEKSITETGPYRSNEIKDVNYFFRVRTKTDKSGKIVGAKYGKMPMEFGFSPVLNITFRYILNPDGTRNLEEDKEKNLFSKKRR